MYSMTVDHYLYYYYYYYAYSGVGQTGRLYVFFHRLKRGMSDNLKREDKGKCLILFFVTFC